MGTTRDERIPLWGGRDSTWPRSRRGPRPPDLTAEPSVILSGVAFDQDGSVARLTATITMRGVQEPLGLDASGAFTTAVPPGTK